LQRILHLHKRTEIASSCTVLLDISSFLLRSSHAFWLLLPHLLLLLLQDVKAHLPAAAHSLYYRDIIGNISSSDTTHTSKEVSWQIHVM
jgi:hypothetical protein